jgi:hypothetical protein
METLGGFAAHSTRLPPLHPALRSTSPNPSAPARPPRPRSLRSASRDGSRRAKLGGFPRDSVRLCGLISYTKPQGGRKSHDSAHAFRQSSIRLTDPPRDVRQRLCLGSAAARGDHEHQRERPLREHAGSASLSAANASRAGDRAAIHSARRSGPPAETCRDSLDDFFYGMGVRFTGMANLHQRMLREYCWKVPAVPTPSRALASPS